MKRKTLLCLSEFVLKGLYDGFVSKPFITLFKNYVDKEFKKVNDFICIAETYIKFIMRNKEQILKSFPVLKEEELRSDLNEIAMVVNSFRFGEGITSIDNFVRMVEYFINNKSRVLDVGAGGFPLSSIKLAKKNNNVAAMDKFIVSDELIKKLNVSPIDGYFDEKTNIRDYDIVVGIKPCSAIGQVVEVCKKENKPYFIHLCECGASDYALSKFKTLFGDWRRILPEIDSDVKFASVYATNIDFSEERLKNLVCKKCKLTKEMQECGTIDFMNGFNIMMEALAKGEEKEIKTSSGVISTSIVNCSEADWKSFDDEKTLGEE